MSTTNFQICFTVILDIKLYYIYIFYICVHRGFQLPFPSTAKLQQGVVPPHSAVTEKRPTWRWKITCEAAVRPWWWRPSLLQSLCPRDLNGISEVSGVKLLGFDTSIKLVGVWEETLEIKGGRWWVGEFVWLIFAIWTLEREGINQALSFQLG